MTFLSDEWVAALDQRLQGEPGSSPTELTVQYSVSTDNGPRSYWLVLGPDHDRAHAGEAPEPDVSFRLDEATARDISDGTLSTEEAFIAGRLTIDGDTIALIDAYRNATDA